MIRGGLTSWSPTYAGKDGVAALIQGNGPLSVFSCTPDHPAAQGTTDGPIHLPRTAEMAGHRSVRKDCKGAAALN